MTKFSDDEEQRPLLTEPELRDTCLHAAATIVVAVEVGCEFEDCRLTDDGYPWPTSVTRIEFKYPQDWYKDWRRESALAGVAMIHEAGAIAVAKARDRGPHRINMSAVTADLLNRPRIWDAVKLLAKFIHENYEGEGCYGALGTDAPDGDTAALKLLAEMGIGGAVTDRDDDDDEDDQ